MELYTEIKAAGIECASHESDLYLPDTEQVRAILDKYPLSKANATRFKNQINGQIWIDVPFAYLPFWERRTVKR